MTGWLARRETSEPGPSGARQDAASTGEALKSFAWSYAKGAKMAEDLDYVPMPAGVVTDVWVDRSETIVRYLEVELTLHDGARRVLLPMNLARVDRHRGRVRVRSILASQFAGVPALANSIGAAEGPAAAFQSPFSSVNTPAPVTSRIPRSK